MSSEIKVGDHVWVERVVQTVFGDGYIRVNDVREEHASLAIPDSPCLPALAVWISGQPAHINALESMQRLLAITKAASAAWCLDGDFRGESAGGLNAVLDDYLIPHDWECMESLISALTPAGTGADGEGTK